MRWTEIRTGLVEKAGVREALNDVGPLVLIGAAVNACRTDRGWSQRELARRANLTQRQISLLENGQPVTTTTMVRVARALGRRLELRPDLRLLAPAAPTTAGAEGFANMPGGGLRTRLRAASGGESPWIEAVPLGGGGE